MRMGVIDVGSNTVHLLAVDAHWGAHPFPASSYKLTLRLSEHTEDNGEISVYGRDTLIRFVQECAAKSEDWGIETLMGFATSAIREAPNGDEILDAVKEQTGVELQVLPGEDESRLTFLAARRWFAGRADDSCWSTSAVDHSSWPQGSTRTLMSRSPCRWEPDGLRASASSAILRIQRPSARSARTSVPKLPV